MKIKLIPEKVFSIQIGEKVLPNFRVVSEWEGFNKLVNSSGQVVIVTSVEAEKPFASMFNGLFDNVETQDVILVKASPDLVPTAPADEHADKSDKS